MTEIGGIGSINNSPLPVGRTGETDLNNRPLKKDPDRDLKKRRANQTKQLGPTVIYGDSVQETSSEELGPIYNAKALKK